MSGSVTSSVENYLTVSASKPPKLEVCGSAHSLLKAFIWSSVSSGRFDLASILLDYSKLAAGFPNLFQVAKAVIVRMRSSKL